jgi:hypothetical protein
MLKDVEKFYEKELLHLSLCKSRRLYIFEKHFKFIAIDTGRCDLTHSIKY